MSARALLLRRRRSLLEGGLVLAGFSLLSVLVTWPLVANLTTEITGPGSGGDQAGYVWDLWFIAEHGLQLWGERTQEVIGAPFGRESPAAVNMTLLATQGPGWVFAKLASPIAAFDLVVLIALATNGAAMYLLVRWLGAGVWPAIWAGGAFVVFPYSILRAGSHLTLVSLACFPLLLLAGWRWIERPTRGRALWLTAAYALCWLTNPYYGFMGTVIVAVLVVWGAVRVARREGAAAGGLRLAEAGGFLLALVVIPLFALLATGRDAVESTLTRSPIELELYGARLSDYVLPINAGVWHGVLGDFSWAAPGGERLAFVGWSTLALACAALVALAVPRWRAGLSERQRIAVASGGVLIVVLVWFSLAHPTRWFGAEIPMPSALVFDAFPFLRNFARFSAAVMAVVLALGAVGLARIVRGRSQVAAATVLAAAIMVAALELPPGLPVPSSPPVVVEGVPAAEVATWRAIRDRPGDEIVYEYPGAPNEAIDRIYMYGQLIHGHRIANGAILTGQIAFDFTNANPDPTLWGAAPRLAALGIDLVTVNPWGYRLYGADPPDPLHPPAGFAVVRGFPDGSALWRVTARPADAVAITREEGWWNIESLNGRVRRWMAHRARVTVVAPRAGVYEARFLAATLRGVPHTIRIEGAEGRPPRVRVAGDAAHAVRLRLPEGRTDLWIVNEGPRARRVGPEDHRVVSVFMTDWDLSRLPSGRETTAAPSR